MIALIDKPILLAEFLDKYIPGLFYTNSLVSKEIDIHDAKVLYGEDVFNSYIERQILKAKMRDFTPKESRRFLWQVALEGEKIGINKKQSELFYKEILQKLSDKEMVEFIDLTRQKLKMLDPDTGVSKEFIFEPLKTDIKYIKKSIHKNKEHKRMLTIIEKNLRHANCITNSFDLKYFINGVVN